MNQGFELIHGTTSTYSEASMSFMTPPDPIPPQHVEEQEQAHRVPLHRGPRVLDQRRTSWYENLRAADTSAAGYARLLLVPGMNHHGGGPTTDNFDMLTC